MTTVDVVVATYNRPARLACCLEALAGQTIRDFRVIVVDDGSTSPAAAAIPPALFSRLDIAVVRTMNGGPGNARNTGVLAGTAPYIAFVDDDVDADPKLLETHLATLRAHGGACASIGPLRAPRGWGPSPWTYWEWRTLDRVYGNLRRGVYGMTWRGFHTGNVMLRRHDFVAVGGFDVRFRRAEDIELAARLDEIGVDFAFTWKAAGWHYSERSRASWLRIARDYGRLQVAIDALHPRLGWLETVQSELGGGGRLTALARAVTDLPLGGPALREAGLWAAAPLWKLGIRGAALRGLSLAYHATYRRALRDAMRDPGAALEAFSGPRPPLDLPAPAPEAAIARSA